MLLTSFSVHLAGDCTSETYHRLLEFGSCSGLGEHLVNTMRPGIIELLLSEDDVESLRCPKAAMVPLNKGIGKHSTISSSLLAEKVTAIKKVLPPGVLLLSATMVIPPGVRYLAEARTIYSVGDLSAELIHPHVAKFYKQDGAGPDRNFRFLIQQCSDWASNRSTLSSHQVAVCFPGLSQPASGPRAGKRGPESLPWIAGSPRHSILYGHSLSVILEQSIQCVNYSILPPSPAASAPSLPENTPFVSPVCLTNTHFHLPESDQMPKRRRLDLGDEATIARLQPGVNSARESELSTAKTQLVADGFIRALVYRPSTDKFTVVWNSFDLSSRLCRSQLTETTITWTGTTMCSNCELYRLSSTRNFPSHPGLSHCLHTVILQQIHESLSRQNSASTTNVSAFERWCINELFRNDVVSVVLQNGSTNRYLVAMSANRAAMHGDIDRASLVTVTENRPDGSRVVRCSSSKCSFRQRKGLSSAKSELKYVCKHMFEVAVRTDNFTKPIDHEKEVQDDDGHGEKLLNY